MGCGCNQKTITLDEFQQKHRELSRKAFASEDLTTILKFLRCVNPLGFKSAFERYGLDANDEVNIDNLVKIQQAGKDKEIGLDVIADAKSIRFTTRQLSECQTKFV